MKRMAMKKDLVANTALALSLLILLSIMLISFWQTGRLSDYERRESLTFDIIQGLDRLLTDLRDVRSDQRDFAASRDPQAFETYRDALQKVRQDLEAVEALKAGAPWLERRLLVIRNLVRQKMAESAQQVQGALDGVAGADGRPQIRLGEIRREASAAQADAVALMRRLSAVQESDFRNVQRLLVANSLVIFLLVSIVFRLLSKEISRRVAGEQELRLHRDQLDHLVTVRTAELLQANRDLTAQVEERQRVEVALQQKETKYRSLFENSLDAVLMVAGDGSVAAANQAAFGLFGMSEEELLGCSRGDLIATPLAAGKQEEGEAHLFEADLRRKDGSLFPAELSSASIADGAGAFLIIHEITQRKWAEQLQRNLSKHEQDIQEQERLSLSREVHDEIGQNLTALKLDLSWIERRLQAPEQELTGRIKEMREGLDRLIVKAQHITATLRPPLLDNLGLAAAIEWQAGEFTRRTGIPCHLMLDEGVEVESQQSATMMMRIFQEALTNVVRHAGAGEVAVSLCRRGERILLEICDDGCGISGAELNSASAFGIMGMRERAGLCRGELTVQGSPGEGTTVSLTIPAAQWGD